MWRAHSPKLASGLHAPVGAMFLFGKLRQIVLNTRTYPVTERIESTK